MVFGGFGATSDSEDDPMPSAVAQEPSASTGEPPRAPQPSAGTNAKTSAPAVRQRTVVVVSESESEDPWASARACLKTRPPQQQKKKKAQTPRSQSVDRTITKSVNDITSAVAGAIAGVVQAQLQASASQASAAPASGTPAPASAAAAAPKVDDAAPPPAPSDPRPVVPASEAVMLPEAREKQCAAADEEQAGKKSGRKQRGTAGTFAGRRPPKNPTKLKLFVAQRAAYFAEKARVKADRDKGVKTPTANMSDFMKHMSNNLAVSGGTDGFKNALASWSSKKAVMKKPAASTQSNIMETPSKRQKQDKGEILTPPKEAQAVVGEKGKEKKK